MTAGNYKQYGSETIANPGDVGVEELAPFICGLHRVKRKF